MDFLTTVVVYLTLQYHIWMRSLDFKITCQRTCFLQMKEACGSLETKHSLPLTTEESLKIFTRILENLGFWIYQRVWQKQNEKNETKQQPIHSTFNGLLV